MNTDRSADEYPADTLGMSPEEMRRLGYKVVDRIIDRLNTRHLEPVIRTGPPEMLLRQLGGSLPEEPGDIDAAMELLADVALAYQQHGDHPRYFARVPGPSSFAGVLGEWLGTGFNAIATSWAGGSGPATVELVVTDWLRQLTGMPAATEGVLLSGGSLANMTAFAVARRVLGEGIVYLTDQTHASLVRGLRVLGFREEQIRILPSDDGMRMATDRLIAAIAMDRQRQRRPLLVCASAGTTNTGAVDPLPALAEICTANDIWFHVDGAYGAPAVLCERGGLALEGMERADSLVLDPHKWLFQPYDAGCLLVRRPGALAQTFAMMPEYLRDTEADSGEVDFRDRSFELSRRSRALKLWLTFHAYGLRRLRAAVQHGIELAEHAEQVLRAASATWEVVTPAQLGIITFALRGAAGAEHAARAQALADSGYAAVTSTLLQERSVLRLCTINPLTTEKDIEETIRRLGA